ncbi:class I adenylate-forming enzyme family protein [Mycoplasmatota bacterium WC30]
MEDNQTLYQAMQETAKKHPNNNALLFMNKYIDYKTLKTRVDSLAAGFVELNIKTGDVVTIAMPNVFEAIFAFYALNKVGVICHMVHPQTPVIKISKYMKETKSNHLVILDTFYDNYSNLLKDKSIIFILAKPINEFGFIKKLGYKFLNKKKLKNIVYSDRVLDLNDLYSSRVQKTAEVDSKLTACLLHSGGTSGEPKTIELSNYSINYLAGTLPFVMNRKNFKDKHMLAVLPMFHGFGLCMGIHGMLISGGVDTLMPKFDANETIKLIQSNQCNYIIGVPSMFEKLLKHEGFRCQEIKNIEQTFVGGDYVALDLKYRWDNVMQYYYSKARLLEGYGLTEVVTVSCVNTLKDHLQTSVGKPLPGIEIGILNQRTLEFIKADTAGEIVISGPTMMNGYLNDPIATKSTIIEIDGKNWIRTGDLGFIDNEGYVHFKQRVKRIIKVSGMPVLPTEIENFMMSLPEIQEVAAISTPDEDKGNRVKLFVVWNKGQFPMSNAKIMELIKTNISKYAVPKEIVILKELPKTVIGKTNILELEKM